MRKSALVWLLSALPLVAQSGSFPTNEQMRHFGALSEPALSPDGQHVLVKITASTADGAGGHVWLLDAKGGEPRQLTFSPHGEKRGERGAQWMPDGQSLVFLAKRGDHTQLFRLPMSGGEAKALELKVPPLADDSKLADALPPKKEERAAEKKPDAGKTDEVEIDVSGFRIAPDGKTIAIVASDPQTPGEKAQKDAKADATWVDHDTHRERLYLLDVATEKLRGVSLPGDAKGASWSADSLRFVAVVEEPNGASELGWANSAWLVTAADVAHPEKLEGVPGSVGPLAFAQDGGSLYLIAQAKQDAPPGVGDLYRYSLATKELKDLTEGVAYSVRGSEPIALKSGGALAGDETGVDVGVRVFANGKADRVKLAFATLSSVETNESQSGWVFIGNGGGHPATVYFASKLGDMPVALKTPSQTPAEARSQEAKRVSWKSGDLTIDGLLYLPAEASTKEVPLVVEVHGGPTGSFTDRFDPFVDYLLGQGWAVLRPNPRGSTGRGATFAAANKNDLGGGDYRDIMAGVDYVLKTQPVDEAKMALIGYSYGGEMAGFVEGKTDRFKAIVSAAPVIDQFSEYGTERGSWYDRWFYGQPWEHHEDAWRQSPLSGVGNAKTPFLLLQGEADTTDPLGQSQEMYRALKQRGVPVEMVTYPRVDHGPLAQAMYGAPSPEPWHGFDARRRLVTFVQKAFGEAAR